MERIRIDCLIFGYRNVTVNESDIDKTLGLILKHGIPATFSPEGDFYIRERDISKLEVILKGKVDFEMSCPLGLYGRILGIKNKIAVLMALCFVILLCIFSENIVWDVRISGNENVSDSEIVLELEKCGLSVGDMWRSIDRSHIENKFLSDFERVSWININRRGSVAYVDVIEKKVTENSSPLNKYTNIVATEDSIIEEITVKSGVAVVKVGDVVKKGDLLISGVLPLEMGGGFCAASGIVKGRVSDRVEVVIERDIETKLIKRERLSKIELNFFDFFPGF